MSPGAYYFGALLTAAVIGWLCWRGDWIAVVVFVPVFAYFAGRSLVVAGFDAWGWTGRRARMRWNGIYYEYGMVHLRAAVHEDRLVFVEDDVLHLIEQPRSRTVELFGPRERYRLDAMDAFVLTEAGCERLLRKCPHSQAKGLLLYLQREAFHPFAKRKERTA